MITDFVTDLPVFAILFVVQLELVIERRRRRNSTFFSTAHGLAGYEKKQIEEQREIQGVLLNLGAQQRSAQDLSCGIYCSTYVLYFY